MFAVSKNPGGRCPALIVATTLTVLSASTLPLRSDDTDLRPDYQPVAYAIRGAKVFVNAESTIDEGTVVIRHGVIESVGSADEVAIPADAEVIDGKGLVVYPGFIDLYHVVGAPKSRERSETGPGRKIPYGEFALPRTPTDNRNGLTPEYEVATDIDLAADLIAQRRQLGFTDLLAAPGGAIATGQSALVSLSGLPRREILVKSPVALHISVRPPFDPPPPPGPDEDPVTVRRRFQNTTIEYPMSLMGAVAHLRQAMLDAEYDNESWRFYERSGGAHPARDPALKALHAARTKAIPTWWEANSRDEILRALDLASEFGTSAVIVGGREADRVADELKSRNAPVVLRVDFPEEPKVPDEAEYRKKKADDRLDPLRVLVNRKEKWEERVTVAGKLAEAGLPFAFSSEGLEKADKFHEQVRKAISHGLPAERAVDALTRQAAEIAGLGSRLGTIEPRKLGHVVVLTADYGDPKAKVRYVFADGLKFDYEKQIKEAAKKKPRDGDDDKEKAEAVKTSAEEPPAVQPDSTEKSGTISESKPTAPDSPREPGDKPKTADIPERPTSKPYLEDQPPDTPFVDVASELEEDREPSIQTGGNVYIKDATLLTVGPAGNIPRGSILVRDGKIAAIGTDLEAPEGVTVIEATGLVAMPGIIDTHSHMAISGGVNEMSLSIVPEVRVRDVVDGDDPTIFRALAGGTTTARLLHGSADAIGGQDVIIKLKHGQAGRDLILRDGSRPQGVKFALGENVTRRRDRFPNTRMGVEATIERAFLEGRAYAEARQEHEEAVARGEKVPPLRRDLRLEALARILDGSIKIHCHCYRSDEILMLLRLAERFGIRVQSLQHVLEGYKVAAEIAMHGASASTFSDWWAYKVEAFDAIPFNAALLTEAGAQVCIKSDSDELVRHLYLEAAKMIKYGGVSEQQALAMITLNPARELGLEHRLGSLEVGKDADIALFNAHPFDSFARCQLALIDGEVWFQRREPESRLDTRKDDGRLPTSPAEVRDRVLEVTARPDGVYAIVGATLHTVSGPEIRGGTLVIADGHIAAIGGAETEVPENALTIDAHGLDVWPGMVDAGSLLGLFEIGSLPETQDFADSAPFQPELRVSTALHPDSTVIPVTRANGILAAYVQPTGGTISGQGCLVDLAGWVPREMVRVDRVALNVNIPTYNPPSPDGSRSRFGGRNPNERRDQRLDEIQKQFRLAIQYHRLLQAAREGKVPEPTPDPRLEALIPYARGEKPVVFRAERDREILDALDDRPGAEAEGDHQRRRGGVESGECPQRSERPCHHLRLATPASGGNRSV